MRNANSSRVLAYIEDATIKSNGATVKSITLAVQGVGETAARRAIKQLEDGGFIRKSGESGKSGVKYVAVSKHEEGGEENMADTATKKAAPAKKAAAKKATAKKAAATTGDAPKKSAGRPRDPDAVKRDEDTLKLITSGKATTVAAIAKELGITTQKAYLSVWRLNKAGTIKQADRAEGNRRAPVYSAA